MVHRCHVGCQGKATKIIKIAVGSAFSGRKQDGFKLMLQCHGGLLTKGHEPQCCLKLIAHRGLQKGVQHLEGLQLHVRDHRADRDDISAGLRQI